jgi:hypothetical protein
MRGSGDEAKAAAGSHQLDWPMTPQGDAGGQVGGGSFGKHSVTPRSIGGGGVEPLGALLTRYTVLTSSNPTGDY